MEPTRWIDPQPGFDEADYEKRRELLISSPRYFTDEKSIRGTLVPNSEEWRSAIITILRASYLEGASDCSIRYAHAEASPTSYYTAAHAWLMKQYGGETVPTYAQLKFDVDDPTHMAVIVYVRFNMPRT